MPAPRRPASVAALAPALALALAVALAIGLALVAGGTFGDDDAGAPPALTTPSIDESAVDVPVRTVEVIRTLPHSTEAFTQGLVWDDGVLYESTGIRGESALRRIDPSDGTVEETMPLDPELFGEGLALVDDQLVQLTWTGETALVWDAATFQPAGSFDYDGEGWGLCHDGDRLVMSNGSTSLTFRDPATFEPIGSVEVTLAGEPVEDLNELECVGDRVYANVWRTDAIVEIDPTSGRVSSVVDASSLVDQLDPQPASAEDVLNGIAYDPESETFWLTGKRWSQLFEVRLR